MNKIEIIIVRHGTPKVKIDGWLRMSEVATKVRHYDESSIIDQPAGEVLNVTQNSHYVVCSNLKRAVDSTKALGYEEIDLIDELFAEIQVPYFSYGWFRLPAMAWLTLYRIMSLFGFSLNGESYSQGRRRSKAAAEVLIRLAVEHRKVLFVGHGIINKLIAKELLSVSWVESKKSSSKYWQYGVYEHDG